MAAAMPEESDHSTWELSKENVQPVRSGRRVNCIATAFKPSRQGIDKLGIEKQKFEEEIIAGDNLDDPIEPWDRYLKWTVQYYPAGGSDMNLLNLLKKYISKFQAVETCKNDPRYVSAWLKLAECLSDPLETYSYMNSRGIGTQRAEFYVAWADEYEKYKEFKKCDRIYLDGDEKCAQPREYLIKNHTAFQLRAARAMEEKIKEGESSVESAGNSNRTQQRSALNGLSGRGKHQTIGSQRTGAALRPFRPSNQGLQVAPESKQPSGFQIFEDSDQGVHVMGEEGQWASAPSNHVQNENTTQAGPWKGVRVKQKHTRSQLMSSVPAPPPMSNFSVYNEDDGRPGNEAPSSARKLASNVESVLSVKKPSNVETNLFKDVVGERPVHERNIVSGYCVDKVYSVMGEMQFEQIRAAHWRKKQRLLEEEKMRQLWEEQQRMQEEERKKREQQIIAQQQRLEEERRRLDEDRMKLMEMEKKFIENERKRILEWQQRQMELENRMVTLRKREKAAKTTEDEQMILREEEDVTMQLNNVKRNLRKLSASVGQGAQQERNPATSAFTIFDENGENENKWAKDAAQNQAGQGPLTNSFKQASSANNSLDQSRRSQPSPTLYTKEALGEVLNWFQDPLPQSDDKLNTTCSESVVVPQPPVTQEQSRSFRPICQNGTQSSGVQPSIPLSAAKQRGGNFTIFAEDEPSDERHLPERPAVKRRVLTEIFQSDVEQRQAEQNEHSEEISKDIQPNEDDKTASCFDDVTVAGSHFAGKARLASTPFCGRAEKLQNTTYFHHLSHIQPIGADSDPAGNMDLADPLATASSISSMEVLDGPPAAKQMFATQDTQNQEELVEQKQLSPIMEASNESEKSSVMGTTKCSRSDSESDKTHFPVPHENGRSQPLKMKTFGSEFSKTSESVVSEVTEKKSSPFSCDEFFGNTINCDLWGDEEFTKHGLAENSRVAQTGSTSKQPDDVFVADHDVGLSPAERGLNVNAVDENVAVTDEEKELNDICAHLDLTSIKEKGSVEDAEKSKATTFRIIDDPWAEELQNSIIARSKIFDSGDMNVHFNNDTVAPKLRKGLNMQLGGKTYKVGKLLGKGAYAKVFDVDGPCKEVIKFQSPPCPWEVYAVNQAKSRLRAKGMHAEADSIIDIVSAHFYDGGSMLVMPFLGNGTLLDMINSKKGSMVKDSFAAGVAYQVMSIVHALHKVGIIHGDVKPDNFMLESQEYDFSTTQEISGIKLIDFGRVIDMAELDPGTAFRKSCGTSGFTCIQMQKKQPWNYHTDFYGIAGTIHAILLGTYMKVQQDGDGIWTISEKLKRWHKATLWGDFFTTLLNYPTPTSDHPLTVADSPLPRLISKMMEEIYSY